MYKMTDRKYFVLLTVLCLAAIATGLYLQFCQGLQPCPLCVYQRLSMVVVLVLAVVGVVITFKRAWRIFWYLLVLLCELFGIAVAGYQVWLQHLAPSHAGGGSDLNSVLQQFSINQGAMADLFQARGGECAVVHMRIMSMSIASWSAVFFAILIAVTLIGFLLGNRRK